VTIVNVLKDGPAALADLQEGDTVISIEGKKAPDLTSEETQGHLHAGTGYQRSYSLRPAAATTEKPYWF
jgi:C-terminal processing protease CtpA/Prc